MDADHLPARKDMTEETQNHRRPGDSDIGTTGPSGNPYCEKLEIPVPSVDTLASLSNISLFHLMVVALLEEGRPLSLDAIAERLLSAGATSAIGDMKKSLLKAWHGLEPIYRDHCERFALDTDTWAVKFIIGQYELKPRARRVETPQVEQEPVADNVPLCEDEVRAAFKIASRDTLSSVRRDPTTACEMGYVAPSV